MSKEEGLKKRRLKEIVEELDDIRGRHTELVTVYVPAGFNFNKVVEQIRNEQSTAMNIKSKTVRKNVTSALEKILQHMKLYKQTPANGLVIFCGNVSDREGVADIELWALEPPEPLKQRLYRCDQIFILDPLKDMIREKEVYGIIVLDKSEADVALLFGKRIEIVKHLDSIVPGKTTKGGWSQARYARIREGMLHDFMKKVGDIASDNFKNQKDMIGVIVAGPGPVKEMFNEGGFLEYSVQEKIIGVVSTSYTGSIGVREAVTNAEDVLKEASIIEEKKILERFFNELGKDTGKAVYGMKEVVDALVGGNLELLLITDHLDWKKVAFVCSSCKDESSEILERSHIDDRKCKKCKGDLEIVAEKDVTDELVKKAEEMGTEVEIVTTETQEGTQLKEMGGVAGIKRYA